MTCHIAFGLSIFGIFLFFLYPLMLWAAVWIKCKNMHRMQECTPLVSVLTIVRNGEGLIEEKIRNTQNLSYPKNRYEICVYSDGSTDRTEEIVKGFRDERLRYFSSKSHQGKITAINRTMRSCKGDIVVFSDADALLMPDALSKLAVHFADPTVGGVCGRRQVRRSDIGLAAGQKAYIRFDSWIKILESQIGSITSNDGKLYAIRRELFKPLPQAVADDLYVCLSIVQQEKRFIFEPEAVACIRLPSRTPTHEITRRKRIVTGSLRGIWLMNALLNPYRYGLFSLGLFINKILRRLLPVFLMLLFAASLCLAPLHPLFGILFFLQCFLFTIVLLYAVLLHRLPLSGPIKRIPSTLFYFFLGNAGTFLGLVDFLRGRSFDRWDPDKGSPKEES